MSTGVGQRTEEDPDPPQGPDIAVCQSCPGKVVFIEADNSDGWIASDTTLELEQ